MAVFDTGIDKSHPDLNVFARADCSNGPPCVSESGSDGHGHGTHVAGTIGAIDNGSGVVGVAPGARLWSVKVVDNNGNGVLSEYIAGIDWVTARADKIEVANASLRYLIESSVVFSKAMGNSLKAGVVHVAAAGNENEKVKYLPGVYPDLITVSAIADYDGKPGGKSSATCFGYGLDDRKASFSNYGSVIDLAAPGVCINSTIPGGKYDLKSGTSMASPHVAGAAALLAAHDDPETKADVEAIEKTLEEEGNFEWTDTSPDGVKEPLLDVGDEKAFVIGGKAAAGVTEGIGPVQWNGATLHGSVDPGDLPTTFQFEYGTTTAYGSKAPGSGEGVGSGTKAVAVDEPLTGLKAQKTYHYRIVATNSLGTVYGADRTFTTASRRSPRFEAEKYPATISGEQDPADTLELKFGASTITCKAVQFDAESSKAVNSLALTAE
ncbi:MAG TPA: S8 family serine peptidase, partial [Solirubrobacterales bacterium]